jgi:hypothetical protein
MPAEPATVAQPKHPVSLLTTYELRDYKRTLERAIAFFGKQDPVPPARDHLQSALDRVLAEQEERTRAATRASLTARQTRACRAAGSAHT